MRIECPLKVELKEAALGRRAAAGHPLAPRGGLKYFRRRGEDEKNRAQFSVAPSIVVVSCRVCVPSEGEVIVGA